MSMTFMVRKAHGAEGTWYTRHIIIERGKFFPGPSHWCSHTKKGAAFFPHLRMQSPQTREGSGALEAMAASRSRATPAGSCAARTSWPWGRSRTCGRATSTSPLCSTVCPFPSRSLASFTPTCRQPTCCYCCCFRIRDASLRPPPLRISRMLNPFAAGGEVIC